jgi:chemotaxis protein MotB
VQKQTLILPSVLSGLVIIGFIALSVWQQNRSLTLARAELDDLRQTTEQNHASLASLKQELTNNLEQISALQKENEALQQEKAAVTQHQQNLEQEMRAALQSKDITISELQGKLTVNILDRILFDSGEAVLKPEGEQILRQIAKVLAQYPHRQIHVIGHTDNVPIKAAARSRFPSNWELSNARATAAVRFLAEHAGVNPQRLGAVGYGEFHPVADNATPEGRAKNRRIAIVVLSEELVGSDAPRTLTTTNTTTVNPWSTNSIPTGVSQEAPTNNTLDPAREP